MSLRSPTVRVVAVLTLTQLIGWGATFYLPAVLGPAMARDLDLSLPVIMAGPTVMLIVMAAASWPLGAVFERHGVRLSMVIGSLLGAAGLTVLALAQGRLTYAIAWILIGLAGAGALTTPAHIAVTEIAGAKARQPLGVLILAGGLTSTIVWPLTAILQAQHGWRPTTLAYAAAMLCAAALHWTTLARRPKATHAASRTAAAVPIDRPRLALLALSFAANGFVTWGFALTIIILFESNGLDHAAALTAAAFIGIAQWAGRMLDVVGGRRWSGFTTGLAGAALFPLSLAVLLTTGGFAGAMAFATLYGIASGITAVARATLPLQVFPDGAYARASAQLAAPLNLAFAAAPPTFAAILAAAGPRAALWLALALSLLAFAALFALARLCRSPAEGSGPLGLPESVAAGIDDV